MGSDEVGGGVAEEVGLSLLFGEICGCEPVLVRAVHAGRFDTVFAEVIVVVGFDVTVFASCSSYTVEVFDADPFVEAVLLDHVVAEMPFAEVGGVVVFADAFGDCRAVRRKRDVVSVQAYGVGIEAGHYGGATRCANRLRNVRVFKHERLIGDGVEIGGLDPVVPIARHRILALLVCKYEEDIWAIRWSRHGLRCFLVCHRRLA